MAVNVLSPHRDTSISDAAALEKIREIFEDSLERKKLLTNFAKYGVKRLCDELNDYLIRISNGNPRKRWNPAELTRLRNIGKSGFSESSRKTLDLRLARDLARMGFWWNKLEDRAYTFDEVLAIYFADNPVEVQETPFDCAQESPLPAPRSLTLDEILVAIGSLSLPEAAIVGASISDRIKSQLTGESIKKMENFREFRRLISQAMSDRDLCIDSLDDILEFGRSLALDRDRERSAARFSEILQGSTPTWAEVGMIAGAIQYEGGDIDALARLIGVTRGNQHRLNNK